MKQIFHSFVILLWMALLSSFGGPLTSLVSADTVPLTCDVVLDISNSPHETETLVPDTKLVELVEDGIRQILTNRLELETNTIESVSVSYQLEESLDSNLLAPSGNDEKEEDSGHRRFLRKKQKPKKTKKKTKVSMVKPPIGCPKILGGCHPWPKPQYWDDDDNDSFTPQYWDDEDDRIEYAFPSQWLRAKDQNERKLQTIDHFRHGDTSFEKIHEDVKKDVCNELRTVHDIEFENCNIYFHCREPNSADAHKHLG